MSSFVFPLSGFNSSTAKITSAFGKRSAPMAGASSDHKGVDFSAAAGTGVLAAAAGKVIKSAYDSAKGNYIQIQHSNGDISEYEHLNTLGVRSGQTVTAGQKIGTVGSTGTSTGNHLHFGVIQNGKYINPLTWKGGGTMPTTFSAADWFGAVKSGATTSGTGSGGIKAPTPATSSGGFPWLNISGGAILDAIEKHFLWILAGLLIWAVVTKKR